MNNRFLIAAVGAMIWGTTTAHGIHTAEDAATPSDSAMTAAPITKAEQHTDTTLCCTTDSTTLYAYNRPGYGKKKPWLAVGETVGINAFVQSFDRFVLNADFAQINMHTIHHNLKTGFVWDNDQFSTNLFAHPYHGGLYFNAARSNGMDFWQSVPFAFGGSLMWETICEIEPPAINDLIATTMGGVCIGEVTHRLSQLVYDDSKRGWARFWREALGAAICPIGALNRIISGDAWKVRHQYYKYHDYNKLPVKAVLAVGDRYIADNNALFRGEHAPYINVSLAYGDSYDVDNNKPYDYFAADVTFGLNGNQPLISSVHLMGRLWGTPIHTDGDMKAMVGFFQHFNYYDSQPVKDGTSLVPYRISEAASLGPGFIYRFPQMGNLMGIEQRIFLNAILLGGSLSDHYNVIDRDYNLGSGFSAKVGTTLDFGIYGSLIINADYYRIYTWKGYEGKDLATIDPIYLNAQGDKGNASLLVLSPRMIFHINNRWSAEVATSYYWRDTRYKYHDNVKAKTFDARVGLMMRL